MSDPIEAVYVRVSTRRQDLASQLPDLERWAKDRPGVRWYRDKFTGRTLERPGWRSLEADVRAGKVASVTVWRLDRLGRTAKGLTALFDELRERGVNLISLRDGLDLSTPAGRLMANVLASVAQYETEVRQERSLAGIEAARAAGRHLGRPHGIHTRLKVTDDQASLVRRLKAEGAKVAAIARAVGLSRPTVYSVLSADRAGTVPI